MAVVKLRKQIKNRVMVTVFFTVMFISTAACSLYYLKTDKENEYISLLVTLTIFSFGFTLVNIMVLILRRAKKR